MTKESTKYMRVYTTTYGDLSLSLSLSKVCTVIARKLRLFYSLDTN